MLYASGGRTDDNVATYPTSNANLPHAAALALAEGGTYPLPSGGNQCGAMWFDGRRRSDGSYEGGTRYFPLNAVLVHDVLGQRVRVVAYTPEGIRSAAGEDGVVVAKDGLSVEHFGAVVPMEGLDFDLGCTANAQSSADGLALVNTLRAMSVEDREKWIAGFTAARAADVYGQFQLAKAIGELGDIPRALTMLNELADRHPDHPQSRFSQAWSESAEGKWSEVWTLLDGVDTSGLTPDEAQHAAHLLGLAGLRPGRWNQGCHMLRQATQMTGGCCNLNAVATVIDTLRGDEVPEAITYTRSHLMLRTGRLVRSIVAADAHLAAGDVGAVIADLDHATVWRGHEV